MAETLIADALTTVQRVKDRLALAVASTGFDSVFLRLISAASEFIKHECGVASFKEATYSQEKYSFDRATDKLFLKNIPATAVATLYYNVGSLGTPSWTAYASDDWSFDIDSGIITLQGTFPIGQKTVAVTYTAGYKIDFANFGSATHTLPADLTELCERLAVRWFKRREAEGKTAESMNGGSITWDKDITSEDKAILTMYKRILF
jgi:hypothetical protein